MQLEQPVTKEGVVTCAVVILHNEKKPASFLLFQKDKTNTVSMNRNLFMCVLMFINVIQYVVVEDKETTDH